MRKWALAILIALLIGQVSGGLISIVAVGDVMPGTNYPDESYLPPDDGRNLLSEEIGLILQSGDVTCGNLEGCILDEGEKSPLKNNSFLFRIPEKLTYLLSENGFDLLSIANNHAGDFGDAGRLNTMTVLDRLNISYAGQLENPTAIIYRDEAKIGFIALSPNRNCLSHWNMEEVTRLIQELQETCDIVIASMHAGGEGEEFLHIRGEAESYYGEDRGNPVQIAHKLVDAGADLVYGHGPHLPRGMECYKGKLIAYSLGNFITWKRFNLSGDHKPLAPILRVDYDTAGNFRSGEIISCYQDYTEGVRLDEQKRAFRLIKKLTQEDFTDSGLYFEESKQGSSFYPTTKTLRMVE
jgi:poly-gamma-glutamate capsule biosynthesis protein CapA/YwtB (metallophosphatase superfamily)